jgi:hypothetical protein
VDQNQKADGLGALGVAAAHIRAGRKLGAEIFSDGLLAGGPMEAAGRSLGAIDGIVAMMVATGQHFAIVGHLRRTLDGIKPPADAVEGGARAEKSE